MICQGILFSFQTEDDPDPTFTYRVDGTGVFTITQDGFVALAVDDLDFETTKTITFKVLCFENNFDVISLDILTSQT